MYGIPIVLRLAGLQSFYSGSTNTHGMYHFPDRAIEYLSVLLSLRHCVRENNALRLADSGDRQECAGHRFSTSSEMGAPHACREAVRRPIDAPPPPAQCKTVLGYDSTVQPFPLLNGVSTSASFA